MLQKEDKIIKFFFLASFGIFGLTALIFQVVFAKALVVLFGLTAPAIATVLAIYFSGLGLGSLIFGKLADKLSFNKIYRLYTAFFALTAVYGFLFPLIFKLLNQTILGINRFQPLNFSGFNFFAFIFSFVFLIFPAILIGGGFPIINKIMIGRTDKLGNRLSLIYFLETFGSAMGAALAGFWLIPAMGNNAAIFSAAGLNLVVAGLLWLFSKSPKFEQYNAETARFENNQTPEEIRPQKAGSSIFFYALFLTGFLALALEVLYTKTLILFIGSSTYAFSLILIIFLLGIALGSWVISSFIDNVKRGHAYFGMFLGLIGFWLFLTVKFFEQLPFWYLKIFKTFETSAIFAGTQNFPIILFTQFVLTFLVIFPATFLMGIIFPLGVKLASPSLEKLGGGVGKLYFSNTFGGVLGSLTAGFFFLPTFGFQKTFLFILTVYILLGVIFILKEKFLEKLIKIPLAGFLIFWGVFAIISSAWSPKILISGVYIYAPEYLGLSERIGEAELKKGISSEQLLFYKEGLSQVAVIKRGDDIFLRVNGKTDASNNRGDIEHEILTGALPLMLHPDPKDILLIGLGSGISLGSVTQFDEPEKIDIVEIDPAIVEAADYFKDDNHDALRDPRVKTILADGRNYLYLTDKKYDVISSQPSNLWVSGNAYLFTKEYYELAKSRLKEDGLMYQWVQLYGLLPEDIKVVLKTFNEAFSRSYLFSNVNDTDLLLIGALNENTILDFNEIEQKFQSEKIQNELGRIHIYDAYEFLSYFVASEEEEIKKIVSDVKVHTDNRPFLEFSAPKTIYQYVTETSSEIILKLREKTFSKLYSDSVQGPEIIKGLSPDSKEKLKNYLIFRQRIVPVILALRAGDLDKALKFYKEAQEKGIVNMILYERLFNACYTIAQLVESEQGKEAAEKVWQKCEILLNEVPSSQSQE